jgi:hypothetical protein
VVHPFEPVGGGLVVAYQIRQGGAVSLGLLAVKRSPLGPPLLIPCDVERPDALGVELLGLPLSLGR